MLQGDAVYIYSLGSCYIESHVEDQQVPCRWSNSTVAFYYGRSIIHKNFLETQQHTARHTR